jgi:tetratricopeptide (TPR) repeat protein
MKTIISTLAVLLLLFSSSTSFAQKPSKFLKTGKEFVKATKYTDAIDQFTKAINLDPQYVDAYMERAKANEATGNYKDAEADYDRVTSFIPKKRLPELYHNTGRVLFLQGKYDLALVSLDKALKLKPKDVPTLQTKIRTLDAMERWQEAIPIGFTAIKINKKDFTSYYLQGAVHEKLKFFEIAEANYLKATKINKKFVDGFIALANVQVETNKLDLALQNVNKAFALNPKARNAFVVRSKVYIKRIDFPNAINDISKALVLFTDDAELFYIRGTYYQQFSQHQNAINDFNKAISIKPTYTDAYFQRAHCYEQISNFADAIKDYQKLTALSEYDVKAQKMLKEANARLFELHREANAPTVSILQPFWDKDSLTINVPSNAKTLDIKGTVKDESKVLLFTINETPVSVVESGGMLTFAASIPVEGIDNITFTAKDAYDNVLNMPLKLKRTETTPPTVQLIAPYASDNNEIFLSTPDQRIYFEGRVQDESRIKSILIDGVIASFKADEQNPVFSATIDIANKNKVEVTATDIYGNITTRAFALNREGVGISQDNPMGLTWVIFIENSNYTTFASLDGPANDVTLLKSALINYQIHNIVHKKDMSKAEMERFFSIELRDLVRSNNVNSLLVWYAGHGKFINETGYWIPVDARRDDEYTYYNINNLKASMQSYSRFVTHTLVITDACESGPTFYQAMRDDIKERKCDDWQATRFKSSQVLSSAGYELAADDSQFTRTFATVLRNNPNYCLPIENIVINVSKVVSQSHKQKPKFGKISGLEDEGGTFFFITKK